MVKRASNQCNDNVMTIKSPNHIFNWHYKWHKVKVANQSEMPGTKWHTVHRTPKLNILSSSLPLPPQHTKIAVSIKVGALEFTLAEPNQCWQFANQMDVAITKPSNNNNARNYEYWFIYLFSCWYIYVYVRFQAHCTLTCAHIMNNCNPHAWLPHNPS